MTPHITKLPTDVICCILQYVRKRRDRFAIMMSCSHIKEICLNRVITPYIEGGKGMKHAIRNGHIEYYKKWNNKSGHRWYPQCAKKAIIESIKNGHHKMIRLLLSENGDKSIDIRFNKCEMLKEAIKFSVNHHNQTGYTDTSMIRMLLSEIKQRKYKIDIIDKIIKYTFCNMGVIKCLFKFLQEIQGKKISAMGYSNLDNNRRLHFVYLFKILCESGRDDILELYHFPYYVYSIYQAKGLEIATHRGYSKIVSIILSWSFSLEHAYTLSAYNNAISIALGQENYDIVNILLKYPNYHVETYTLGHKARLLEHLKKLNSNDFNIR